jgi:hypothetical protein
LKQYIDGVEKKSLEAKKEQKKTAAVLNILYIGFVLA